MATVPTVADFLIIPEIFIARVSLRRAKFWDISRRERSEGLILTVVKGLGSLRYGERGGGTGEVNDGVGGGWREAARVDGQLGSFPAEQLIRKTTQTTTKIIRGPGW